MELISGAQMKLVALIITLTLVSAKPTRVLKFTDDLFYADNRTCFVAQHDIVDVHLPVQHFDKQKAFIVEADLNNGTYRGTYILDLSTYMDDHKVSARKLLDNGKCITSDEERVYFGTTNGIYAFNFSNEAVEKYGSITADIRDIEKHKEKDLIYIVTEENKLFLVTDSGNKMVEHDTIRNVQEIAMNAKSNLYFYEKHEDEERPLAFYEKFSKPKVLVGDDILNITGLPDTYTNIKLLSFLQGDNAVLIFGNIIYSIYPNGSSEDQRYAFLDVPTAGSVEAGLVQLYGHDRKLYCFFVDLSAIAKGIVKVIVEGLKEILTGKS